MKDVAKHDYYQHGCQFDKRRILNKVEHIKNFISARHVDFGRKSTTERYDSDDGEERTSYSYYADYGASHYSGNEEDDSEDEADDDQNEDNQDSAASSGEELPERTNSLSINAT